MQARTPLQGRRLLVIDDDPLARSGLARLLEGHGAQVQAFAHGPAAVAWCASHPRTHTDAAIVDLQLPFMSGAETLSAVRSALHDEALPALAITASLEPERAPGDPSARRLGFDALLLKPLAAQDVLHWLEHLSARAGQSHRSRRQRISQLLLDALQHITPDGATERALPGGPRAPAEALATPAGMSTPLAMAPSVPDAVCRLVYRSVARFDDEDMQALLSQSQSNNQRRGITGLLIHDGHRYVQVLEGRASPLHALFERLLRDTRHTHIEVLEMATDQPRLFSGWSMASATIDPQQFDVLIRQLERSRQWHANDTAGDPQNIPPPRAP